jgi:hypothetical protein
LLGLGPALIAQVNIHPPGEQILLIPQTVAVAKKDEGVLGSHTR